MIQRVLVTGGAGFIGSHLSLKLLSKGYKVVVLDNLSKQVHGQNPAVTSPSYTAIKDVVDFIKGDVTSRRDMQRALKDVDVVIHLAAETGTGQSMYDINRYVSVNIGGTAMLLDILANGQHQVKKVIVAESRAVYGEGRYWSEDENRYVYPLMRSKEAMSVGVFDVMHPQSNKPLRLVSTTEDSCIHPTSVYGITKQVQGQLVHLVCRSLGIESISFRYQNVYGPGQSLHNPYTGILAIFSTLIKNRKEVNIYEDGLESRDFIYIDDVVTATIRGLEVDGISGATFNVGSGIPINVLTVAETLKKAYGIDVPLKVSGDYRVGDIRHNYADITKAKELLGFVPQWSFDEGIKMFVQWVNEQHIMSENYEASDNELKQRGRYN